jgi:hypothetical protein
MEMEMIAKNETFENMTISLDGASFYECAFSRCIFTFSGLIPVALQGCTFNDCTWTFVGAASNTILFMTALYRAGGADLIEGTFRAIRGEQTTGPISMRH